MSKQRPAAELPTPSHSQRLQNWRRTALALVVSGVCSLAWTQAQALALGRTTVISALGEPLQAEIDIPDINPDEVATLQAAPASADAFRAAGLEYNTFVNSVQIKLSKRADGRPYLQISSDKSVTDPYLDLFLTVQWAGGRITRDYTLLFDPPAMRHNSVAAVTGALSPITSSLASPPANPAAANSAARTAPARPAPAKTANPAPTPAPAPEALKAKAPAAAPAATPAQAARQVQVKQGDTAGHIAAVNKPLHISLDQMLLAILRSNPDAFIEGNVNRIRAGAVLQIPDEAAIASLSQATGSNTIQAQSQHFDRFRNKLSEQVPTVETPSSARKSSGNIQAQVEEKKPAQATPDKLKLTSDATARAAAEKSVQDARAKETAARMAELQRNIEELKRLTASLPATPAVPAPASPADKPQNKAEAASPSDKANAPSEPVALAKPAQAANAASSASAVGLNVAADAARKAPAATAAPAAAAEAAAPAEDFWSNPMLPAAGAGLLTLLLAIGVQRWREKRKNEGLIDSSFNSSHLQADSFFGGSGGQHIDTNESQTGSSLAYSPSQLDAVGDVDPVAEADVYLAYGRDLQAEEILKEALRVQRTRMAIHAKLCEIYAKRRDNKSLAQAASDAYVVSEGEGPEWEGIAALGRDLDPTNPLYDLSSHIGGDPVLSETVGGELEPLGAPAQEAARQASVDISAPISLMDIDLDLSGGQHSSDYTAHGESAAAAPDLSQPLDLGHDLLSTAFAEPHEFTPAQVQAKLADAMDSLSLDLVAPTEPMPSTQSTADTAADPFSMAPEPDEHVDEDPLSTKLSLAEEFRGLGDLDGARTLVDEVLAEASGDILTRAQRQLDTMF